MAINLYSGVPGSGKSLLATYQAIEYLLCGRNVIANFPLDMSYFRRRKKVGQFFYEPTKEMSPKFFVDFANEHHDTTGRLRKKVQTLVIIDEASMLFNSRTWQSSDRSDWIFFLANHRHLNYEFIIIAQIDRMLDRQIRGLIETEFKCRAITAFGLTGKILSFITGGLFVAVPYNYSAKVKALVSHFFRLHRRKARVYDTMMLFDDMSKGGKNNGNGQNKQPAKPDRAQVVVQTAETGG